MVAAAVRRQIYPPSHDGGYGIRKESPPAHAGGYGLGAMDLEIIA